MAAPNEIMKDALNLAPAEKAELIDKLLSSLDNPVPTFIVDQITGIIVMTNIIMLQMKSLENPKSNDFILPAFLTHRSHPSRKSPWESFLFST